MQGTIQELIDNLSKIENKNQPYIGAIYIAEDFTYETEEGEEKSFLPEQLQQIMNYRTLSKSMGYFYDEVYDYLHELLKEQN
jgi:hypothetical protein